MRERRFPDSLRGRLLVVLASFVVLVAAGSAAAQYWSGRRMLTESVERRLERDARGVADRVARRASDVERAAALFPVLEAAQDVATDDVDKRYSTTLASLTRALELDAIAVAVNGSGRVVAASDGAWLGRRVGSVPGLASDTQALPGRLALVRAASGEWRLVAGAPITARSTGAAIGRLVVSVPWATLVRSAAPPVGTDAIDIAGADGSTLWRGERFAAGEALFVGRAGGDAPPLPLTVAVGEPRGAALAPVREGERATLVLALIVLAVALPAAALVARGTTGALDALARSALAVDSEGHAALVAPTDAAPHEVRVLHGALATMLARQEDARRALADREVLALLGTMAAALAHEIRTPLAVVHGSAELLARGTADEARRRELVTIVTDETRRLERLVEDLLAFARPRPPQFAGLDLAAICRRAADVLAGEAARHRVTLALALERAPARGDPEQLQQVVLNLASNAIQLSPAGATVTIATRAAEDHTGAAIEVRDQGPGIPESARERIWTPFFTTRRGGTGLGLAIVRRIVDAHGARVDVESPAGGGTIMRVVLPAPEPS